MSTSKTIAHLCAWSGLWLASLVWAVNMQLGQVLPYLDCRNHAHASAIASFAAAAIAALSAVTSWRFAAQPMAADAPRDTFYFIGASSALAALVFTFALAMQGIAAMVLSGCER
jgi:NADPH:quinone reductase-like Zn-dependent oxidoreductase